MMMMTMMMRWVTVTATLIATTSASQKLPIAPRSKSASGGPGMNAPEIDFQVQEFAKDLSCQKWTMERFFQPHVNERHVRTEQQKTAFNSVCKALNGPVTVTFDKYELPEYSAGEEGDKEVARQKCKFSTGEEGTWTVRNKNLPQRTKIGGPSSRVLDEYAYERFMEIGPVLEIEVPDKTSKKKGKKGKANPVLVYSIPLRRVEFQKEKIRSASQGLIRWKPSRKAKTNAIFGLSGFHTESGPNIVDPRWAKGRKWYWSTKDGFRKVN